MTIISNTSPSVLSSTLGEHHFLKYGSFTAHIINHIMIISKELSDARVHPPLESGIYKGPGGDEVPAKSIVMANRPEYPNEDHGETL